MLSGLKRPCTSRTEFFKGDEERYFHDAVSIDVVFRAINDVCKRVDDAYQKDPIEVDSADFLKDDESLVALETSEIVSNDVSPYLSAHHAVSQQSSVEGYRGLNSFLCEDTNSLKSFVKQTTTDNGFLTDDIKYFSPEDNSQTVENVFQRTITKIRSKGFNILSFIDDVSTAKLIPLWSPVTNLSLIEETPLNKAKKSKLDDTTVQPLLEVHEVSPCTSRHVSQSSYHSLHKASTFLSIQDIFQKTMKARRKNYSADDFENDDDEDRKKFGVRWAWSATDYNSNEVVKQVLFYDDE